ncbi:MAG: GxxExxY protein [Desulfacinum sp.]|jgi:GxxExxY protein|nr:GxxExxY protein [Desulfacinum sp.]
MEVNEITSAIIGAAIEVHRHLGPGLLESTYEECLAHELSLRGISFRRQHPLPLAYKGRTLDCGYRLDFLVEDQVIVELKACEKIEPIHKAQVLTYLRLTGCPVGLLINFHTAVLKDGIHRIVLTPTRS